MTPFLISPKGEMIEPNPNCIPSPLGEGWEGGNINPNIFILYFKNISIAPVINKFNNDNGNNIFQPSSIN